MMGQRPPPTTSKAQCQGAEFQGSPLAPRTRSLLRSCLRDVFVASGHQRANDGGGDAHDGDAVALGDVPEAVGRGVVGGAVVEGEGGAEHQRAGDGPGTHHPADVGEPEEGVVLLDVEEVGHVLRALDGEAAVDMDGAFGLAGGAGGVDQHVGVFGVGEDGLEVGRGGIYGFVPPGIAVWLPGSVSGVFAHEVDDEEMLNGGGLGDGGVGGLLHLDELAAAIVAVGGDEDFGAAVLQAGGDGLGAVAGEDGDEDGAEFAAGEGGGDGFWDHGHVDGDDVAFADAEGTQGVGGAVRHGEEVGVGVGGGGAAVAFPGDGELVGGGAGGVLIEGGDGVVELAAGVPGGPGDAA